MNWISRLFFKPSQTEDPNDPLEPVPVIPLRATFAMVENTNGRPLTEEEALKLRDDCPCILLPRSKKHVMAQTRGYEDLDPEHCWEQWLALKASQPPVQTPED